MRRSFCLALLLAACGGTATGGEGGPQKVYVEFDQVVIEQGPEDATTNTSGAFGGTLTRYRDGLADRDARIASVLEAMASIVEPFRLEVVDTRPDIGRYDMIVIAGTAAEAGLPGGGVAAVDCENLTPNKVVVVFGNSFPESFEGAKMASLAIAGLGTSQGMPSSDVEDDCLCWSGASCNDNTKQCTFGGPGTRMAAGDPCAGGQTTMDPQAEFEAIYGVDQ